MSNIEVKVTEKHIVLGTPKDACNCAVALAIAEAIGGARVFVCPQKIGDRGWSDWYADVWDSTWESKTFKLPAVAKALALAVDRGEPVQPISFELEEIKYKTGQ